MRAVARSRRAWVALLLAGALASPASSIPAAEAPFAYRGVVEASYGPPWSAAARLDALSWMAAHGLNTYVHAPKNDPFGRARWRDPYPADEMTRFRDEISLARSIGIAWIPNISPGFPLIPPPSPPTSRDVCFACPSDLRVIYRKLDPFFAAGARTLMVSFDDVQKVSTHPEDLLRYGAGPAAYGRANRDLLNAVYRRYRARAGAEGFRLLTVLADYSGTADTDYLRAVRSGPGLDPGIEVFWTGTTIVGTTISENDAASYAALVGRSKVLLWDNYPANDYTGNIIGRPVRLFLGPLQGRAADLPRSLSGILANPMNEAVASRIALATLAEYLADPIAYDPEAAWRRSIEDLAGGDAAIADAVAAFAENSRSSSLNRLESPAFSRLTNRFLGALEAGPFWTGTADDLIVELDRERAAPATIAAGLPAFFADASAFLARLAGNASVAETATSLLRAQRPSLTASVTRRNDGRLLVRGVAAPPSLLRALVLFAQLGTSEAASLADYHAVHGDRATVHLANARTMGGLYTGDSRLDRFVLAAEEATARWLPLAALAASRVSVTVNGRSASVSADGAFSIVVSSATLVTVIATDGSGGRTGLRLSP